MEDYSFSGLIAHFLTPLSFALLHLKVTQLSQFSVFSMEFSGKLQMVFAFFSRLLEKIMLILAWFESSISSPCKCQMTKLSLLLKTGDITRGKKGNGSAWVTTGGLETNGFNHLT